MEKPHACNSASSAADCPAGGTCGGAGTCGIAPGLIFVSGDVNDVMRQVRQTIVLNIQVTENEDGAAELLADHKDVVSVDRKKADRPAPNGDAALLVVKLGENVTDYSFIPTLLIQNGYRLTLFKEEEINLETAFMALTKGLYQ